MATKKIEIQDSNGNVYYPHTDASVVKNGNTTVAEQLNDMANPSLLINGDFQVWQRGESFNILRNYNIFTADRWCLAVANPSTDILLLANKTDYGLRISNTKAYTKNTRLNQGVEIPKHIQGKEVTFSITIKSDINKKIGMFICNVDRLTKIATKTINVNNIETTYSITGTIPSGMDILCVGLALSSDADEYIGVVGGFDFPVCNIDIKYAKLELGDKATPFVPRPYAQELVMCQRYYCKFCLRGDYIGLENKHYYGYSSVIKPRIVPTISIEQADIAGTSVIDNVSVYDNDIYGFSLVVNKTVGSAGDHYRFQLIGSYDADIYI